MLDTLKLYAFKNVQLYFFLYTEEPLELENKYLHAKLAHLLFLLMLAHHRGEYTCPWKKNISTPADTSSLCERIREPGEIRDGRIRPTPFDWVFILPYSFSFCPFRTTEGATVISHLWIFPYQASFLYFPWGLEEYFKFLVTELERSSFK